MHALFALLLLAPATAIAAQAAASLPGGYPQRPVRLITGSPGSTAEITARLLAHRLSERWGQQVIVDSRGGAGGMVGAEIASRSAPDGHTMVNGHIGTHASPQFLLKSMPYDPVRDFTPVARLTVSGIALVVSAPLPVKDLREFVAMAKAKPDSVNYASLGGGTSSQLSGELFNQVTGARLWHVPYKGAGPAITGVISGEVQSAFLSTTTISAHVRSGKMRVLAVLSRQRMAAAPDIPTADELGFPGVDSSVWFGLFAPARTPRPLVEAISAEVVRVIDHPDTRALLLAQGAEPAPLGPEPFRQFLAAEIAKWGKVIRAAGLRME